MDDDHETAMVVRPVEVTRPSPPGEQRRRPAAPPAPPPRDIPRGRPCVEGRPIVERDPIGVGEAIEGLGEAVMAIPRALGLAAIVALVLAVVVGGGVVTAVGGALLTVMAWLPVLLAASAGGAVTYVAVRTVPDMNWAPLARRVRFVAHASREAVVAARARREAAAQAVEAARAPIALGPATATPAPEEMTQADIERGLRRTEPDTGAGIPRTNHRRRVD